jgi:secreted PhoX family phosphatase
VLVNIRLAADVGAPRRWIARSGPRWIRANGNIYVTLTNNSQRGSTAQPLDPANPRFYADNKGATVQRGNNNGHIVRMAPSAGDHASLAFTWDVYLFGAQAHADAAANESDHQANVNLSGLTDANDFSSPDGCWFSQATPGLLWLQTDDGAYTDVTNCMLLAALPGTVGDGSTVSVVNKAAPQGAAGAPVDVTISTRVGKKMEAGTLKRFLVGPKGCELTGVAETPDGKAVFVQIQHPGEETTVAQLGAGTFQSNWPQGGSARPRSSTVVITRNDGGKVGLV